MSNGNYRRRLGGRADGRRIRTLTGFANFIPYIMPSRCDSLNYYEQSFEITNADRWFRKQRISGYKGIGALHLFIAAYIRAIASLPALNRFVVGRHIYLHNEIEIVMTVKRALTVYATETTIKVAFAPTDTIFDVYNKMNAAITRYVRSTYNVLIGDSTADRVKREIGTVWTEGQPEKTIEVKGRNLVTGLPQKITLSSYELEMPLRVEVERIITALQSVMEQTPPELVADIEKTGLLMTGGGAMLDGLDKLITNRVRIQAHLAENPIEAVAIGTGKSFEYLGKLYDGFVSYTNYSSR